MHEQHSQQDSNEHRRREARDELANGASEQRYLRRPCLHRHEYRGDAGSEGGLDQPGCHPTNQAETRGNNRGDDRGAADDDLTPARDGRKRPSALHRLADEAQIVHRLLLHLWRRGLLGSQGEDGCHRDEW